MLNKEKSILTLTYNILYCIVYFLYFGKEKIYNVLDIHMYNDLHHKRTFHE